jgi:hypothetical protein
MNLFVCLLFFPSTEQKTKRINNKKKYAVSMEMDSQACQGRKMSALMSIKNQKLLHFQTVLCIGNQIFYFLLGCGMGSMFEVQVTGTDM